MVFDKIGRISPPPPPYFVQKIYKLVYCQAPGPGPSRHYNQTAHHHPTKNFFQALGALSKQVLDWYGLVMFGRFWLDPPPMAEW